MKKLKVNVVAEGLTDKEQLKLEKAVDHFERAINSRQFLEFCNPYRRGGGYEYIKVRTSPFWKFWNRTYKRIKREIPFEGYGFKEPNGRKDLEIYNHLMTGAEVLDPMADGEADIYLKIDRRNKRSVIGYTYGSTKWQWIYINWFRSFDPNEIAGNLSHEWCHKMGYKHAYKNNPTRKYSVPYAVGYFVRDFIGE